MKTKVTNTPQQNRKNIEGRLSLNLPLSSRKNLNSIRLSIPNRKDSAARPSISSIQSRSSLPVNANNSRTFELPYKKEYIIENLMKKLQDEQELRSIIESKYLGNDQFSTTGRLSFKQQTNSSRCSNCNCSQIKMNTPDRPTNQNFEYRDKRKSNYLQQKIRNFQQQLFLVKQTAAELSQSTIFLYKEMLNSNMGANMDRTNVDRTITNMDRMSMNMDRINTNTDKFNERKSFGNFVRPRQVDLKPKQVDTGPNQVDMQAETKEQLQKKVEQKQNENCHKAIQNSFLSNLDSTLSILGNVSVARVR